MHSLALVACEVFIETCVDHYLSEQSTCAALGRCRRNEVSTISSICYLSQDDRYDNNL